MVTARDEEGVELAEAAVARVPAASGWRRLTTPRIPDAYVVFDEAPYGRCPHCGRLLPSGGHVNYHRGAASAFGALGLAKVPRPLRPELAYECLVHGPRRHAARDLTLDQLCAGAGKLADRLDERGWKAWGDIIRSALDRPDPGTRAEGLMLALERFRRWSARNAGPEIETLIASLGPHLPAN